MVTILTNTNNVSIIIQQTRIGILIKQILIVNQIFLKLIHESNNHDNHDKIFLQDKIQQKIIIIFNQNNNNFKILWIRKNNQPNQMQIGIPLQIIYNMKSQRLNLQIFFKHQTEQNRSNWLGIHKIWVDHLYLQ